MTQPRTRPPNRIFRLKAEATGIKGGLLASALLAVTASGAVHLGAQPPARGLRIEISFSATARSEPVTGMDASDLVVNGQPATNVAGFSSGVIVSFAIRMPTRR